MSGFSNHLAQQVINHFIRGIAQPATVNTYIALHIADPTDANITTTEISAAWYARQQVTSWTAPAEAGDYTFTSNTNDVAFPVVAGGAVTTTHYGIYDAKIEGNLLSSGLLPVSKVLNVDDVPTLKAGEGVLKFK